MLILVAPLNWGLGHASRCIPLIQRFLDEGNEVIIGGDGESLLLLRKHFPQLRVLPLAPLQLKYSKGKSQVGAMLRSLPKLIKSAIQDHYILKNCLRTTHIDKIVSDNRFGLYNAGVHCVYITHQVHIRLPKGWRWAEKIADALHARVYNRYNELWIPDREDEAQSLGGALSHPAPETIETHYIGPLSRFERPLEEAKTDWKADVAAVLSGLEPQRSMIEKEIIARYEGKEEEVVIVQGKAGAPKTRIRHGNITLVPHLGDEELAGLLKGARPIIARSGYSTIMDLDTLGLLEKSDLVPTPGQPEQEYLLTFLKQTKQKTL